MNFPFSNSGGNNNNSLPQHLPSFEELSCLFNTTELRHLFKRNSVHSNTVSGNQEIISSIASHLDDNSTINRPHLYQPLLICSRSWDGILVRYYNDKCSSENHTSFIHKTQCWPETVVGQEASLPCFAELNGVHYDTSQSATRFCDSSGEWENFTDYTKCLPLTANHSTDEGNLNITTAIYVSGYGLSLCFLIFAFVIFVSFKELRCIRNKIHTQLILTYILSDSLWIITNFTSYQSNTGGSNVSCVTFILLHYVHLTNFFWMFVEGLYLYVLVVQTFVAENIKLRIYGLIGWGIPLLDVILWSFAKWMTQNVSFQTVYEANVTMIDPEFSQTPPTCLWLNVNEFDWIYKAPVIIVLAANIVFLFQIMWVLITKLRSAMNPETQQSRKAAKALLVLMPLLGITYVLILTGSKQTPIYEYIRALLISTQGFLVALLYCFLNGEVRTTLRHHWSRIKEVGADYLCCGCECEQRQNLNNLRDWSPRSRTESIRLFTPTSSAYRKRESSASDATSMTILHGGAGGSLNNGSGLFPTTATYFSKNRKLSTTIASGSPSSVQKLISKNEGQTFV